MLNETRIDQHAPEWQPLLANLQANILKSHGREHSASIFLRFTAPPVEVKRWIGEFGRTRVTSALAQFNQIRQFKAARAQSIALDNPVVSVFLSAAGYRYLKLDVGRFGRGGRAFRRGMKAQPGTIPDKLAAAFARLLDINNKDSTPDVWEAAYKGAVHAMILLARDDGAALDADVIQLSADVGAVAAVLTVEYGHVLRSPPGLDETGQVVSKGRPIEHFGYVDGRSNPLFLKEEIEREEKLGIDRYDPSAPLSLVLAPDPFARESGSYGSYLVFRKLQQDVARFNRGLEAFANQLGVSPELAGAWSVGRFKDGTPITLQGTAGLPEVVNNFDYTTSDWPGNRCPPQSHIRKTNPRAATLLPRLDDDHNRRIVRRGIPYGEPNSEQNVGLLFMCYQSDISRQFEHIQRQWADNRGFPRYLLFRRTGMDPIIGQSSSRRPSQRWSKRWDEPAHQRLDFGGYVGLRGGEYFFAPSMDFLTTIDSMSEEDDMTSDARMTNGEWKVLPYNSQVEAVHMALLHTGKVVYYSGFRVAEAVPTETRLWNPRTGEIKKPPTPGDLFCAGHCFLPDGRLLSTGGTLEYRNLPKVPPWFVRLTQPITPPVVRLFEKLAPMFPWLARVGALVSTGATFLYLFSPRTEQWEFAGDMPEGRWYPTNTCLPDGRILILSGTNEGGGVGTPGSVTINRRVEIYDAQTGLEQVATIPESSDQPLELTLDPVRLTPTVKEADADDGPIVAQHGSGEGGSEHGHETFPTVYPRMHVLPVPEAEKARYPAGKAFCAGYGPTTRMLDLKTWEWSDVASLNWGPRDDGCSVLLSLRPPDYRARVFTFGGHRPLKDGIEPTETAEMIDLSAENPTWTQAPPMKHKRLNACAVLLPDGKVLAVGGNTTGRFDDPVYEVQVFDPDTGQWSSVAPMTVPRGYHSTAILLPDGRVLSSGTTPFGRWELRMEVYSPYYLFRGKRPVILKAPKAAAYHAPFEVAYRCDEGTITSAVLIRPGAVTHAFDMDQRLVELEITTAGPEVLTVVSPRDEHVAPPGYYMLFLLNDRAVPSEAVFVRLSSEA